MEPETSRIGISMRKIFLAFCAVILLLSGISLSACDKNSPEFDGDPIDASGSLRWDMEEERIYLDITLTNNTNKDIKKIRTNLMSWVIQEGNADWQGASRETGDFPYDTKFNKLKPGASGTYSINISNSENTDPETGVTWFVVACKLYLSIISIEFGSYGLMPFEDNSVVFEFEGYK